jgi:hypothetical protein
MGPAVGGAWSAPACGAASLVGDGDIRSTARRSWRCCTALPQSLHAAESEGNFAGVVTHFWRVLITN